MGSRERKIILIIALIVAAAVIAAVCIYMSPESPAEENASVSPAASASAAQAGTGSSVIISELMEKNRAVLRDEDGDFSDWIELHNVSGKPVSLGGWRISDKSGEPGWAFPDVTIEPGEYLLVFASGKDKSGSELHTDFSLSGDETVYLLSPAAAPPIRPRAAGRRPTSPWRSAMTANGRSPFIRRPDMKTAQPVMTRCRRRSHLPTRSL